LGIKVVEKIKTNFLCLTKLFFFDYSAVNVEKYGSGRQGTDEDMALARWMMDK
jgi:hypothetical protein